jgi:hypothetical protein
MQQPDGPVLTFYRVTRSNPPTLRDFLSNVAKRRRPPDDNPETLRMWGGLSVYDTVRHARAQAQRVPAIGSFIATMQIPAEGSIHYEQTTRERHHFTLWGDADHLIACVVSVVPV